MIPPCDPAVLENNPQFKRLHQYLTTTLLNRDGTSAKGEDADPARRAVAEDLRAYQIRHGKRQILMKAISQIALDSRNGFPDELRDITAVTGLYIQSRTAASTLNINTMTTTTDGNGAGTAAANATEDDDDEETLSLLGPDIQVFRSNMGPIARHLSPHLSSMVNRLRMIADAKGPAVTTAPVVSHSNYFGASRSWGAVPSSTTMTTAPKTSQISLSSQLASRLRQLRSIQMDGLPSSRRQMAVTAAGVLAARAELMERMVILLERTKYGSLARGSKAQAEHFATVAEAVERKIRVTKLETLSTIYTPETTAALSHYHNHLHDTRARLEEKQRIAIKELKAYEAAETGLTGINTSTDAAVDGADAGETTGMMIEIARRYGALVKQVENVKMEIRRLGR